MGDVDVHVKLRLWLEDDRGHRIMGEGVASLLLAIDQTGSLNQAAQLLNMSYRSAWSRIGKTEERLGYALVIRKTGGSRGGGCALTVQGRSLLDRYHRLVTAVESHAREQAKILFQDSPSGPELAADTAPRNVPNR